MTQQLVTARELAATYKLSAKTIRKWARSGLLPVVRLSSRCLRFDREQCAQVILQHTRFSRLPVSRRDGASQFQVPG